MNTIFSSEINVRPDDIDLNNHVHNAKYQMSRKLRLSS